MDFAPNEETQEPARRTAKDHYRDRPYPDIPLHAKVLRQPSDYLRHSVSGAFYRKSHCIPTNPPRILDVGCGTGVKTLAMALANPGAQVIGIDSSMPAISIARDRQRALCIPDVQFLPISLEEIHQTHQKFDYINCDDVVYLLEDPADSLRLMASVLADEGIIRGNVHNMAVRQQMLSVRRALDLLNVLHLPIDDAVRQTQAFYAALHDGVSLKRSTGGSAAKLTAHALLANQLLVDDKAFTFEQTQALIAEGNLAFLDFVDYPLWDAGSLFSDSDQFADWHSRVAGMAWIRQLKLVDALHYRRRLYDFWCVKPSSRSLPGPFTPWTALCETDTTVQLHPALVLAGVPCMATRHSSDEEPLDTSTLCPFLRSRFSLPESAVHLLALLGTASWSVKELANDWLLLHPRHPSDRRSRTVEEGRAHLLRPLAQLVRLGIVVCCHPAASTRCHTPGAES